VSFGPPNDDTEPQPGELAYESPEMERPASAAPTERVLEDESLPAAAGHDPYAALRFPTYRIFQTGWMLAVFGSQITSAAIGWEIFDRTHSKLALGWVAGVQVIPVILLALPAGALADMFDRRRIIQISCVLAALCSICLAGSSYRPGSIPLMFVLMLLLSTAQNIGRPARWSLLPQLVPTSVFSNAVTWNSSFFQIASMAGPATAGLVIAGSFAHFKSIWLAYALDATLTLIYGLMICFLPRPAYAQPARPDAEDPGVFAKLSAGVRFVWSRQIIFATMTLDLFAVLLGGVTYLLPVFAKDILHVGSVGFGWLRASEAIGAFCMGMIIAHLPPMRHAGRAMLLAVAGFGAVTIVFGLSKYFWLSFAMMFLVGAFDNVSVVVRHSLVQILTPDSMRGRVSAVNNIFIGAGNELGGVESGLTAAAFTPVISVVGGGIATILIVIGIALKWPAVRRFGRLQPAPEETTI
jgi:MFS family permease